LSWLSGASPNTPAAARCRAALAMVMSAVVLRRPAPVPAIVGGELSRVGVAITRRRAIRTHLDRAGDRQ
jgi:hypothetical protein